MPANVITSTHGIDAGPSPRTRFVERHRRSDGHELLLVDARNRGAHRRCQCGRRTDMGTDEQKMSSNGSCASGTYAGRNPRTRRDVPSPDWPRPRLSSLDQA